MNFSSHLILFRYRIDVAVIDEACSVRSEDERHVSWSQCLRGTSTTVIGLDENIKAPLIVGV
jgi:hypothetical protein